MTVQDSTQRFSSRVDNYLRYRPGYPAEVVDLLKKECGLTQDSIIADIAFGTGIFTRLLLENGNRTIGVEPNAEMRRAGEEFLAQYPRFSSVAGTAEATTLPSASVDIVTAAQAAHWFDAKGAKTEFARILKPAGWVVLLWNDRRNSTEFQRQYEQLILTYGTDYKEVRQQGMTLAIEHFFGHSAFRSREFKHEQIFDCADLEGRLLSSSYAPQAGEANYEAMIEELRRLFDKYQINGSVSFDHDTRVYYGQVRITSISTMAPEEEFVPDEKNFHMSPGDFRRNGHAVVDWIADYYSRIESYPVLSRVKPGAIRDSLPASPPASGEPFKAILGDVEKLIIPGITHWQSPNFFAFFPSNTSGASILGDLLSSGLGVQGMLWATSPACTELESHVLDWLVAMLDLPNKFLSTSSGGGVIQDTASSSTLCALLAARERATNSASNRRGCDAKLVAYTSTQAHSSIEKNIQIAGIGRDNLRLIEVDANFAMNPDALSAQVQRDRAARLIPFFVCATVGTTSSNAIDPLAEIGPICREQNLWLHVDAAMSGTAALCPEFRHIHNGIEFADSYCFNPHKWMFTNFDCDCFYVADRKSLIQTLSVLPEYLRNQASESGAIFDYRDWQIPLGRRFRSLKLWFVIRHYGVEGLQYHIRQHVELAQQFAQWVREDERFELAAPVPLNLICFRRKAGDDVNQQLMDRLNRSGDLYITHTRLNDQMTLRLCVAQTNTQQRHVKRAWKRIQEEASLIHSQRE